MVCSFVYTSVQKIMTDPHVAWVTFHGDTGRGTGKLESATSLQGLLFHSSDPCQAWSARLFLERKVEAQRGGPH